jgi:hypothetical protein
MGRWLKPSGYFSHVVGFNSHGLVDSWNGLWAYSDLKWRVIRGKSLWSINREPYSVHMRLLASAGSQLVTEDIVRSHSDLRIEDLAPRFQSMDPDDLTISDVFFQGRRVHGN